MKKLVWFVAGFALSLSVAILGWPTVAVDTTDLDAATDSRSAARVDLLDAVQKLNIIIADRGIANGVAALTSTGGVTVPKTCVAGYTRIAVNYCMRNAASTASFTRDACTTVAVPSSSGAVALRVGYRTEAKAANAVLARSTYISSYTAAACGGAINIQSIASGYEFSGLAAGTVLSTERNDGITEVIAGNSYLKLEDDAGNQGTGSYFIAGYFD